ncbi:alpha-L-rhamnosidase [Bifidobacterium stellenboschense]|uniref:alpha-L-rhamnosidase n=1 Tax=Bifidobacterium stellenboschense TaxID=762211 RepID=A0A087DFM3_9BIFI|nr:alpha-L-rhamnosidase [Bifidobacterium stellenboschense]KFI94323.1 alfa-L-rhamnosidase [Bifidobacterium stellenboschense]
MKVSQIRVNGIDGPLGFDYGTPRCSWLVEGASDETIAATRIEVSDSPAFSHIVHTVESAPGSPLDSAATPLDFRLEPRTRYHVRVTATGADGTAARGEGWFETGKMDEPWEGRWITPSEEDNRRDDGYHPEFAREFAVDGPVEQARLYICGLGLFEAELNGRKVGDEHLTPYTGDYDREVQSIAFDVTGMLDAAPGATNTLSVRLGNGWYKGRFGLAGKEHLYGDSFRLVAELRIRRSDGTETVIGTDAGTWRYRGSDTTFSGIYDGETLDRTRWAGGDNPWKPAVETSVDATLTDRLSLPVTVHEILPVREVVHTPAGETVLDFGQNFAGCVAFRSHLPAGVRVTLDFGEILQHGDFYNANYRSAKSRFVYVSDGREETVAPSFTYFGFRYVRVTGWPEGTPLDPADFEGRAMYSDLRRTGRIDTGRDDVNRLVSNALWGQRSNFVDLPTDCPQRDERLGWTGDAQVFCGTASYAMDTAAFYRKFLHDLRGDQRKLGGGVPGVIPMLDPHGAAIGAVWGDAATFMPTILFERYADKTALRETYPMMRDWIDWIADNDRERGARYLFDFCPQLGDWLALNGRTQQSMKGGTDDFFISSCYWAESTRMTADAAAILGLDDDERRFRDLYGRIREAVLREYYTPTGRLAIDTQTGYVVALYSGIYPDKDRLVEAFRERLYKDCYRISGGFVGAPIMCRVMADNGMGDEAMNLLLSHDFPGWMHCIDLGATTIWERWNSMLDDGTCSGTMMNSFNHYAFGSVVEYLYRNVAGLTALEPGFRRARIAPMPDARLGHCRMSYDSAYGRYRSEWEILADGDLHVTVEVPFGCEAEVRLPFHPDAAETPDAGGRTVVTVGAGVHGFTYTPTRDMRARYSRSTLFKRMLADDEAMAIIARETPMLAHMLVNEHDEDYLCDSLDTLGVKFFMGFDDATVARLADALLALRA